MFGLGIFDWLKMGAGAVVGALVAGSLMWNIGFNSGETYGLEKAKAAVERQSNLNNQTRGEINAKVDKLDGSALCRELGGKWVQSTASCE